MSGSTLVSRAAAQEDDCNYREAPGGQQPLSGLAIRLQRLFGAMRTPHLDTCSRAAYFAAAILVHVIPRPFFPK